jgi:hypothetical protein
MVSILQAKDIKWQVGLKSKTLSFVAYKKCVSLTKTKN